VVSNAELAFFVSVNIGSNVFSEPNASIVYTPCFWVAFTADAFFCALSKIIVGAGPSAFWAGVFVSKFMKHWLYL
jgi:hypothetical protein